MWVPTTTPLPTLVTEKHPSKIRVGLEDGTHTEITWPVMVGDSAVESDSTSTPPVAVRDITAVQVREMSVVKTIGLAIAIPAVVFYALLAIAWDGD